ncbi:hypothetical protein [Micromonospora sp. SL4-19]|uniref:hypothetical protein n=1 Tax=Micromonospora sp. SL4-19 TaxID=3399129 RepID=UPI003A4E3D53
MFTQPKGQTLTAEQAVALDDEFFGSRPLAHMAARIASLLTSADVPAAGQSNRLATCIAGLGAGHESDAASFTDADRDLHVATEAFAARHHAAETLVRLYHALAVAPSPAGAPRCVWSALCDGPTQTATLVDQASAHLSSDDGHATFWKLVLPASAAQTSPPDEANTTALNVMAAWLQRAMLLLLPSEPIDLNAAYNKIKHGMAVRARNDLLAIFTKNGPDPDETMSLSALTGSGTHSLIDGLSVAHLSRPRAAGRKQGLEMTTLNLPPAALLAETWMLARTHAAMFHIAAERHFAGRRTAPHPAPEPLLGPTPDELLGDPVVGIRHPVTTPPGGGAPDRQPGIALRTSFIPLVIHFDQKSTATVVDG